MRPIAIVLTLLFTMGCSKESILRSSLEDAQERRETIGGWQIWPTLVECTKCEGMRIYGWLPSGYLAVSEDEYQ